MSPSPIRCRGPWKLHKRSSEPDRWLDEMGFFRKHTARDSSCLFRAVSENIYNTQRYFHMVRLNCIQFMASKRHLFEGSLTCPFENYLKEMSNPSEWGGLIEISAMSHLYRRDFVIFEANKGPQTKICNGYGDTIFLFYSPESKHFDAVYTKEYIDSSSFCQSLVYEILYDGVYQLKDLPYAVDKMLHDKIPTNHIEYFMSENVERRKKQKERAKIFIETTTNNDKDRNNNAVALKCKHHTQDLERASILKESLSVFVFNRNLIQLENVCMNCLNVNSAKDLLDNGITPFPYKVAKALDPDIYRNIEFDVWSEMRRELRYGTRYSDGTTLQVGVKCLCKLQLDQLVLYHCHIQEMRPDGGPCLVFIEELGEKRVVNYDQLQPLPQEEIRPWAPPYRYSRANSQFLTLSQMLHQIGNVTRKQGLSRARRGKGNEDRAQTTEKIQKQAPKLELNEETNTELSEYTNQTDINMSTYQHLDLTNFQPVPVEVQALPLMVDCRPAAGAPPHELAHAHAASNGAPPENHHKQSGASGDMGQHGVAPPAARASTPATASAGTAYAGGAAPAGAAGAAGVLAGGYGCAYACAPPPPPVNPHVYKSVQPNGADLPMNDIPTLRYYFNLGVECMWAAYASAPPPPPPPRHYSPRDLVQDMQAVSLQEREHKHKAHERAPPAKPHPQRPLLGPRFKRGNNQDGNQNSNHNQNKGHNNNMGNKGPNNRRNSHTDTRNSQPHTQYNNTPPEGECVMEQPMMTLPYIPYPPPLYPIPCYPVDTDPGMMGMMGGMGFVGYEDGMEFGGPMQPYYPPPAAPLHYAHPQHHLPPHPHPHQHLPHQPHQPHQPHPHHVQHQEHK